MTDPIATVLGVSAGAFAIWLTVQIVSQRKSWRCAIWGAGVVVCGAEALSEAMSINPFSHGWRRETVVPLLFCVAGFLNSYWTQRKHAP
jgi:hypothetical protein